MALYLWRANGRSRQWPVAEPPRLPADRRPTVAKEGLISEDPNEMPDTVGYDAGKHRLLVGHGFMDHATPAMWNCEVSGKQILTQWFSYRKRDRERPIIGDRRKPSALGDIQPDHGCLNTQLNSSMS